MHSTLILTSGQPRPELHLNKCKAMNSNTLKSTAEPQYEAPAVAVLNMQNEGILCASTQEYDDELDWVW